MCEEISVLRAILLSKDLFSIMTILVPLGLIVMCAIDLFKYVASSELKDEKIVGKIAKRMIVAGAVFFVPLFVSLTLGMVDVKDSEAALACLENASSETLETLVAQKEAEKVERAKAAAEKRKKEEEEAKALAEAEAQKRAKEEELKKEKETLETVDDPTFLKENGTDGKVKVIDGVFYKPASGQSGAPGTEGSGPYHYNIYFYNRLKAFVEAGKEAGYTITMSTTEYGAWRPLSKQEYYYLCMKEDEPPGTVCTSRNLAAAPGTSNHGWGIASDLSFNGSTQAKYWAHDNAAKFGLKFNLCNNVRDVNNCREDWHIEPSDLRIS